MKIGELTDQELILADFAIFELYERSDYIYNNYLSEHYSYHPTLDLFNLWIEFRQELRKRKISIVDHPLY